MENGAIEIFFSVVDEDREFYQKIKKQLRPLLRERQVLCWSQLDMLPGENKPEQINNHLESAQVIALLLSPDYLDSDQHYNIEAGIAMRRQQASKTPVIPILVRPCNFSKAPFVSLRALPSDNRPVSTWENPDQAYQDIAAGLEKVIQQISPAPAEYGINQVWTVPYPRNALFTGREAELQAIETALSQGKNAAISQGQNAAIGQPQALSGLGGIGKTQLALEYAYRHRAEYRYIFWVLADTRDTLNAHYSKIAEILDLPSKNQPEQRYIIEAVKSWLERNQNWLLILDNADDLTIIPDFLPPSAASGHILFTTRSRALGRLAESIEAKKLDAKEGISFLLHRSSLLKKLSDPEAIDSKEHAAAQQIVRELDGLPLALDQAGAYIEETSCGLQGYLALYRKEHKELLKVRGGHVADHPDSVAQTVQLAFKKVEKANPAAADLLRLCAFLAPEDIPEMIIEKGEAELTNQLKQLAHKPLKLNAAIAELQKYSLISRNAATKTLDVYRLVQVVLRDSMTRNGGTSMGCACSTGAEPNLSLARRCGNLGSM